MLYYVNRIVDMLSKVRPMLIFPQHEIYLKMSPSLSCVKTANYCHAHEFQLGSENVGMYTSLGEKSWVVNHQQFVYNYQNICTLQY